MSIHADMREILRKIIDKSPQRMIDGNQCYLYAAPIVNRDGTFTELYLSMPERDKHTKGYVRITRAVSHKDFVEVSCRRLPPEDWNGVLNGRASG